MEQMKLDAHCSCISVQYLDSWKKCFYLLLFCNDILPEPQHNISMAAVRGAIYPFIAFICPKFRHFMVNKLLVCSNVSVGNQRSHLS